MRGKRKKWSREAGVCNAVELNWIRSVTGALLLTAQLAQFIQLGKLINLVVGHVQHAQLSQLLHVGQARHEVIRDPQLLERIRDAVEVFDFFDEIFPQRQNRQVVHPRQGGDFLDVVGGEGEVLARLQSGQRGVHLLDGRHLREQQHLLWSSSSSSSCRFGGRGLLWVRRGAGRERELYVG